jgi:hypothetical protein
VVWYATCKQDGQTRTGDEATSRIER